jgi:hypothetical protein
MTSTSPTMLNLLRFRGRTLPLAIGSSVGLLLAGLAMTQANLPVWGGTMMFLGAIAIPVALKFRDDLALWGMAACVLGGLLLLQGFHTIEHVVQLIQFYVLNRPPVQSQGLISSLNVEWVHFIWNWTVWGMVVFLMRNGMKSIFTIPFFVWMTMHSLEHTYMLLNYLHVSAELGQLNLPQFGSAQVLPGVLGRDGWLANNLAFCRNIPGLSTLPRVAVHFYWNVGEMILLLLAAREALPKMVSKVQVEPTQTIRRNT